MKYYVYALIDPENNTPFYIGKGVKERRDAHFKEANKLESDLDETTLDDLVDAEIKRLDETSEKLLKLRYLIDDGYTNRDIARFIAKDLDENTAIAIEALLIKTIYGFNNLTNKVQGQHAERFRPFNNWDIIEGFDTISSKNNDRNELLSNYLNEQLDESLRAVADDLPEITFCEPKVMDAGELGVEGIVEGILIKIAIRRQNIQLELRGRRKSEKEALQEKFKQLGKLDKLRKDHVFLPEIWKGKGRTSNQKEVSKRAKLLVEIISANSFEELSSEAKALFN